MGAQLLDWHVAVAALSGVLAVASAILYIKDVLKGGETRPNVVSFFLWTVLQGIAFVGQIKAGASWSAVFVFFMTLDTAVVTVIALMGYGYKKYGLLDLLCFILATAAAVVLWQNPVNAIVIAIIGDFFAFCPTIIKTRQEPRSEHLNAWALITVASVLGVISTDVFDTANLAFPIYQTVMNGTIFCLAYFGRKRPTALN